MADKGKANKRKAFQPCQCHFLRHKKTLNLICPYVGQSVCWLRAVYHCKNILFWKVYASFIIHGGPLWIIAGTHASSLVRGGNGVYSNRERSQIERVITGEWRFCIHELHFEKQGLVFPIIDKFCKSWPYYTNHGFILPIMALFYQSWLYFANYGLILPIMA